MFFQICVAEATYLLIPNMTVKKSNVMTRFVQTGLPQNRTIIAQKYIEKDEEQNDLLNDLETSNTQTQEPFEIEGRDGLYVMPNSIHEQYSMRPEQIENINLAQFAISYVPVPTKEVNEEFFPENLDYSKDMSSSLRSHIDDEFLPKYIKLDDGTVMRCRNSQMILRQQSPKNKSTAHEKIYSVMLLFLPWRKEENLHPNNEQQCRSLYDSKEKDIQQYRKRIYPFSKTLETLRKLLEDTENPRPQHIYDGLVLDPEGERDNEDLLNELPPLDRTELPLDENIPATTKPGTYQESTKVKPVEPGELHVMIEKSRMLSYEQKLALNIFIHYVKAALLAKQYPEKAMAPHPPNVIVSGKTYTNMY